MENIREVSSWNAKQCQSMALEEISGVSYTVWSVTKFRKCIAKVCIGEQRGVARQMQDVRKKMEGCN